MAATPLCEAPLAALKKSLRDEFPDVKSSHLTEALAYSLGFRTWASMRAAMNGPENDRPFHLLRSARFVERLIQLGHDDDPEFDFEMTFRADVHGPLGVVSTIPTSGYDIEYRSTRSKAWRNVMVAAVNAALDLRLVTLHAGDNRFSEVNDQGVNFDFELPDGLPVRGFVSDAGWDELNVYVAVNPKRMLANTNGQGFETGDAIAHGWLERRRGAWLQSSTSLFQCRRPLIDRLAGLQIEPQGFGDRGGVIM